jgi:hypothetical protein
MDTTKFEKGKDDLEAFYKEKNVNYTYYMYTQIALQLGKWAPDLPGFPISCNFLPYCQALSEPSLPSHRWLLLPSSCWFLTRPCRNRLTVGQGGSGKLLTQGGAGTDVNLADQGHLAGCRGPWGYRELVVDNKQQRGCLGQTNGRGRLPIPESLNCPQHLGSLNRTVGGWAEWGLSLKSHGHAPRDRERRHPGILGPDAVTVPTVTCSFLPDEGYWK